MSAREVTATGQAAAQTAGTAVAPTMTFGHALGAVLVQAMNDDPRVSMQLKGQDTAAPSGSVTALSFMGRSGKTPLIDTV